MAAAVVATIPFVPLTRQVAAHMGRGDLRVITIGHPLGTADAATVAAFAQAALGEAVDAFFGDDAADGAG